MPNDAKLGLLAGVVAVVVVAAVYFQKPAGGEVAPGRTAAVSGVTNALPDVPPAAVGVPAIDPAGQRLGR